MSAIDTSRAERRKLRFHSIDELQAEIDRLIAAERAGTLRRTGNWTLGQIFGHLATWLNYAYEGYPMKVPFFIRWLIRMKLKSYLRDGMPAGVRIPKVEAGTYGVEPLETEEGARRFRKALLRLKSDEPAPYDSPAFGRLNRDERIALNLRHAELHLGFVHPS